MQNYEFPLLSTIVFLPLMGIALLLFVDRRNEHQQRGITLITSVLVFALCLFVFYGFQPGYPDMQFVERRTWLPQVGIDYFLGVDGISLLLIMLTTFLIPICVVASWMEIRSRVREFYICLLLLETGMLGVFLALDLFLFYVFWELTLIPMFLLILIWGNPARRVYSAVKFFLYTMGGSIFMLVAILVLYWHQGKVTGMYSFDLLRCYQLTLPKSMQLWLFIAFAVAFAVKVPIFPFHTWLPDAHTEAPTVGSVILAAILLKMGTYGFIRFNLPLFPYATNFFIPVMVGLAIVGIVYGAMMCLVQKDLKRLIAFSSVSHLGFVVLGIFTLNLQGIQGSLIQMVNHGLSTGALFLLVGMLYERRHTRMIADFGGLSKPLPVFAVFFMLVTLASIGLPGLNGFVGEFLILLGAFKAEPLWAVLGATGVILAAWYMLWMFQRVMFGKVIARENRELSDLVPREIGLLVPIIVLIVWIGVYPQPFLSKTETSVAQLVKRMDSIQSPVNRRAGLKPSVLRTPTARKSDVRSCRHVHDSGEVRHVVERGHREEHDG